MPEVLRRRLRGRCCMAVEGYEGLGDRWRLMKLMEGGNASGKEIVEVLIV